MSSKRAKRRKGCEGKRRFETQAGARAAAMLIHLGTGGMKMDGYRCRFCKRFHIGHRPGRRLHRSTQ